MPANDRPPLRDSPWFWLLLFALFALALLIVFGDKYRHRQSQLERQFQSKELRDAREFEGKPTTETTKFSSPDNLIMPLWPLAALLIVETEQHRVVHAHN